MSDTDHGHGVPSPVRLTLGGLGLLMLGFGIFRILEFPKVSYPGHLAEWLIAAVILHDGILAPIVTVVGYVLARAIPGRARAYVQGALVTAGTVTLVAIVLIYRQGKSQPGQALLEQNYTAHLLVILGVIVLATALLYGVRVLRDRGAVAPSDDSDPPPAAS